MSSSEIRQHFLDFFESKQHKIVPSAPIVNKDDPSLMFTNAGMNQFKDFFLGNATPDHPRLADTQKCLRVSGKHNDLEEVGTDGTHHTMFEMLGNWSIGDYFKKEAIAWAWELLTSPDWYGLPKDRLYASIFEGYEAEGLGRDEEAASYWEEWVSKDRILDFGKKDNFWEMGDTGPCGPCSEIHIDLRSEEERAKVDGASLVNMDHPEVIEIWNLVFIQFNRKADGSLEKLPATHVDTGMGFERLCLVLQGKTASYDTDIFTSLIQHLEKVSGKPYTASYDKNAKSDMAIRVVVDHIRAVSFAIADGQLPESGGAGYVIRRILRRAVRYYYSFLGINRPILHELVPILADYFGATFPELSAQKTQIAKIVQGEEKAFLNTLEKGIRRFEDLEIKDGVVDGQDAFELYDTYGFPIDLTLLMASEKGYSVDKAGFDKALQAQKDRARAAAAKQVGDWVVVHKDESVEFVGYDHLSVADAKVLKYRIVNTKKGNEYQVVLNQTPFYGESGGQRGDTGLMWFGEEKIPVLSTQKENDLIIHIVKKLPTKPEAIVRAEVNASKRQLITANHSGVHLMHAALHEVLGDHALQKGQDVDDKRLRFDFSHFGKMSEEEVAKVEAIVNQKIRANIPLEENRNMPIDEAKALGATMLFGEKYGDTVRMVTFDENFSRELCGGTHVPATGEIGVFKILSESGVAAGIRRIEAVTSDAAEGFLNKELEQLEAVRALFKNPKNIVKSVSALQDENKKLHKQIEQLLAAQAAALQDQLKGQFESIAGINLLATKVNLQDAKALKTLAYNLEKAVGNAVIIFGAVIKNKPQLMVTISENLTQAKDLHAGKMVRELAKHIKGGGGGQAFFATAGGKDENGLDNALAAAREMIV
ncbi:MAG: alanine--tRNA ligase [Bacteroidota bacterium]